MYTFIALAKTLRMTNISDVNQLVTVFEGQRASILCVSSGSYQIIKWTTLSGSNISKSCVYNFSEYTCISKISFTPTPAMNGSDVVCLLDDHEIALKRRCRLYVSDGNVSKSRLSYI